MTPPTKPMSAEEMEPCPKCQQTDALALVQVCAEGGWGVSCFNCHLSVDTRAETTAYAVIDWNRRAPPLHPEGEGVLGEVIDGRAPCVRLSKESYAELLDRAKRLLAAEAALTAATARAEALERLMDWLTTHPGAELSHSEDPDEAWQVHIVTGGVNDREWRLVGDGETPVGALRRAAGFLADGEG